MRLTTLGFVIPVRTRNPLNGSHGSYWGNAKKRKIERSSTALHFKSALGRDTAPHPPVHVALTRIGPRLLDDDNVQAALKSIRDEIAKQLGVDDGDRLKITFSYEQLIGKWSVVVRIRERCEMVEVAADRVVRAESTDRGIQVLPTDHAAEWRAKQKP